MWDRVFQAVNAIGTLTGLVFLFQIARAVGAWEQWRKWAEEQLKSLGSMAHDMSNKVSEIIGRLGPRP